MRGKTRSDKNTEVSGDDSTIMCCIVLYYAVLCCFTLSLESFIAYTRVILSSLVLKCRVTCLASPGNAASIQYRLESLYTVPMSHSASTLSPSACCSPPAVSNSPSLLFQGHSPEIPCRHTSTMGYLYSIQPPREHLSCLSAASVRALP